MSEQGFKVGEGATFLIYTDAHAGTIIKTTKTTVLWQRDSAKLLNGPDSGEPDALKVCPGGFAAHVSGSQRYAYERDSEGQIRKFTRRVCKRTGSVSYKLAGHRGSGCSLHSGRHERYDYNY